MAGEGAGAGQLAALRAENALLREELGLLKARLHSNSTATTSASSCPAREHQHAAPGIVAEHGLTRQQVERYSRQLLLPRFGIGAQAKLCESSVLVVGCGGLGAPAALYLAAAGTEAQMHIAAARHSSGGSRAAGRHEPSSCRHLACSCARSCRPAARFILPPHPPSCAGVGRLGLVDHDVVETSNLHRQVIHNELRLGVHKATSAAMSCAALNSSIRLEPHLQGLSAANAVQLVQQYDLVVDASDNPSTRYLISDACAATGRPLVSAAAVGATGAALALHTALPRPPLSRAALKPRSAVCLFVGCALPAEGAGCPLQVGTDGQLTVYCHGEDGPCYRWVGAGGAAGAGSAGTAAAAWPGRAGQGLSKAAGCA
jgi:adenylyltransferase/sulfurtransferase